MLYITISYHFISCNFMEFHPLINKSKTLNCLRFSIYSSIYKGKRRTRWRIFSGNLRRDMRISPAGNMSVQAILDASKFK